MNKITLGLFSEHKLILESLGELLAGIEEFEILIRENILENLLVKVRTMPLNVLIIHLNQQPEKVLDSIALLKRNQSNIKILVISSLKEENIVLKTIKSGANGFLDNDSDKTDLIEAVYTLRNGHDYYSKSITHILLKRYLTKISDEQSISNHNLSDRETEILKLWGDSHSNQEIAAKLFISIRTVESHKNHIMQKLNLKTTVDLIKFGIKNNLIKI